VRRILKLVDSSRDTGTHVEVSHDLSR